MSKNIRVERNCISSMDIGGTSGLMPGEHTVICSCPHCEEAGYFVFREEWKPQAVTCSNCFADFVLRGEIVFQFDKYLTRDDYLADENQECPF